MLRFCKIIRKGSKTFYVRIFTGKYSTTWCRRGVRIGNFSRVLVASQLPSLCGRVVCSQRIEYACLGLVKRLERDAARRGRGAAGEVMERKCCGGHVAALLRYLITKELCGNVTQFSTRATNIVLAPFTGRRRQINIFNLSLTW